MYRCELAAEYYEGTVPWLRFHQDQVFPWAMLVNSAGLNFIRMQRNYLTDNNVSCFKLIGEKGNNISPHNSATIDITLKAVDLSLN